MIAVNIIETEIMSDILFLLPMAEASVIFGINAVDTAIRSADGSCIRGIAIPVRFP